MKLLKRIFSVFLIITLTVSPFISASAFAAANEYAEKSIPELMTLLQSHGKAGFQVTSPSFDHEGSVHEEFIYYDTSTDDLFSEKVRLEDIWAMVDMPTDEEYKSSHPDLFEDHPASFGVIGGDWHFLNIGYGDFTVHNRESYERLKASEEGEDVQIGKYGGFHSGKHDFAYYLILTDPSELPGDRFFVIKIFSQLVESFSAAIGPYYNSERDGYSDDQSAMLDYLNSEVRPLREAVARDLYEQVHLTIYRQWVYDGDPAALWTTPPPPVEKKTGTVKLSGCLRDGANNDMPNIRVYVDVIDLTSAVDIYDTKTRVSRKELLTDPKGTFNTTLEVDENNEIPAIRFSLDLTCYDKEGNARFEVVDDAANPSYKSGDNSDEKRCEPKKINVAAVMAFPPDRLVNLQDGNTEKVSTLLSFRLLGQKKDPRFLLCKQTDYNDYNKFFYTGLEGEICSDNNNTIKLDNYERLANASILYTTMHDAYSFAVRELAGVYNVFQGKTIKVILNSKGAESINSSYFSPSYPLQTEILRTRSLRDDNSIFAIMHEFGHLIDYNTGGNDFHVPNNPADKNHHGLFNPSMNDSYQEGFATFFAAEVRKYHKEKNKNNPKYKKYKNPERLRSDINVKSPWRNFAYRTALWCHGDEEGAITTFLYHADPLVGGIRKLWPILNKQYDSFNDVYSAICKAAGDKKKVEELAVKTGLFRMPRAGNGEYDDGEPYYDNDNDGVRRTKENAEPYTDENGNGKYDEGEEFIDQPLLGTDKDGNRLPKNGVWDGPEPWLDLSYAKNSVWTEGLEDPKAWLNEKDELEKGVASDYDHRTRKDPPLPLKGRLAVESDGNVPYLVIRGRYSDGSGYSQLVSVTEGTIGLLSDDDDLEQITVELPGGSVIYQTDPETVLRLADQCGNNPVDTVYITSDQLAEAADYPVPTYGDGDGAGYLDEADYEVVDFDDDDDDDDDEYEDPLVPGFDDDTTGPPSGGSTPTTPPGVDPPLTPPEHYESDNNMNEILGFAVIAGGIVLLLIFLKSRKNKKGSSGAAGAKSENVGTGKNTVRPPVQHAAQPPSARSMPTMQAPPTVPPANRQGYGGQSAPQAARPKFCRYCGSALPGQGFVCPNCGGRITGQ